MVSLLIIIFGEVHNRETLTPKSGYFFYGIKLLINNRAALTVKCVRNS